MISAVSSFVFLSILFFFNSFRSSCGVSPYLNPYFFLRNSRRISFSFAMEFSFSFSFLSLLSSFMNSFTSFLIVVLFFENNIFVFMFYII